MYALLPQAPPPLDSGRRRNLCDMAPGRPWPVSSRFRTLLVTGSPGRRYGCGRSSVWRNGAPLLPDPCVGDHAQPRPRYLPASCRHAGHHAMAQGRTSRVANRILGRAGTPFWQDESFDHWVRSAEELQDLIAYVENNPVKAGLVETAEEWEWSSAGWMAEE